MCHYNKLWAPLLGVLTFSIIAFMLLTADGFAAFPPQDRVLIELFVLFSIFYFTDRTIRELVTRG